MPKLVVLLLSLTFTAASCNLTDVFNITTGSRGVFKSEDGGERYKAKNTLERKGSISNVSVNAMAFDPSDSETIYLGSSSGIYKTKNGAKTWEYILTGIAVADIAVDQRNPKSIYAAGLSSNNGKIVKSVDGGDNWTDVYTEASKSNPVTSLAVSSSFIIAGLATGEIIRSFDGGQTWQAAKDLSNRIVKIRLASFSSTVYTLTRTAGVFVSNDSGGNWTNISNFLTRDNLFGTTSVPPVSIFYDFSIDLRQSGVTYLAAEQGLFRTVNDGQSWNLLSLPLKDTAPKVSAVVVNPSNSNNIFVSVGSTVLKSLNGGITWETKELRTEQAIRLIAVDSKSPNVVYLGLGEKK